MHVHVCFCMCVYLCAFLNVCDSISVFLSRLNKFRNHSTFYHSYFTPLKNNSCSPFSIHPLRRVKIKEKNTKINDKKAIQLLLCKYFLLNQQLQAKIMLTENVKQQHKLMIRCSREVPTPQKRYICYVVIPLNTFAVTFSS